VVDPVVASSPALQPARASAILVGDVDAERVHLVRPDTPADPSPRRGVSPASSNRLGVHRGRPPAPRRRRPRAGPRRRVRGSGRRRKRTPRSPSTTTRTRARAPPRRRRRGSAGLPSDRPICWPRMRSARKVGGGWRRDPRPAAGPAPAICRSGVGRVNSGSMRPPARGPAWLVPGRPVSRPGLHCPRTGRPIYPVHRICDQRLRRDP